MTMTTRHNFDYFAALHSVLLLLPLHLLPLRDDLAGRSLLAAAAVGAAAVHAAAAGHVCSEQPAATRGPLKRRSNIWSISDWVHSGPKVPMLHVHDTLTQNWLALYLCNLGCHGIPDMAGWPRKNKAAWNRGFRCHFRTANKGTS